MRDRKLKIPPPIIALVMAGIMWLVARAAPTPSFTLPARHLLAAVVALAGVATALMGIVSFRRVGTTVKPLQPEKASSLVTSGIYRMTRNPMYLGLLMVLIAWGVLLSSAVAFVILPAFILYMNCFQITPEENALALLFGREFAEYKTRVRRWL